MLWTDGKTFRQSPFEKESEIEDAILVVAPIMFGRNRYYLDAKRRIGAKGKTKNIPDGYLLDLASPKQPRLYVVENELAKHDPLRHIAVQILEFSLSFETTPQSVKSIVKEALSTRPEVLQECQSYAENNGYNNIDFLLETIIYGESKFNALVIIDELDSELETVLISRFKFPVEILTLERYRGEDGKIVYHFTQFLEDLMMPSALEERSPQPTLDLSDIDTIVVPARDEGFNETFLGENRWYKIRIHTSMIAKLKYIAVYRVAPESAITHIAPIASINQWEDTNKYVLYFREPAHPIGPIRLVSKGMVKPLFSPRYSSYDRLMAAKTLDEAF